MPPSLQRPSNLQPSQPSQSKTVSPTLLLNPELASTQPFPYFSSVLAIHFLYFIIQVLTLPIHHIILVFSSAATFCLAISLVGTPSSDRTRKLVFSMLYPLTSSLSSTFLATFFYCEEVSNAPWASILASTGLSAVLFLLLIQIKNLAGNSEQAPTQTSQALQTEKDQAVRNSEEQKFLTTMLCHESRNILNCLTSVFHFLEIDLNPVNLNLQKAKKDLVGAKYCCETLLNYFNNYIDNHRSAGTQQETSDLPEVIHKAQEIAKSALKFKGLESKFTVEGNIPSHVLLNDASILQIILNLIYNSIKFTDKGSVHVNVGWQSQLLATQGSLSTGSPSSTAGTENKLDSLSCLTMGSTTLDLGKGKGFISIHNTKANSTGSMNLRRGKLILRVTDTGCGMSQEDIGLLFQPFSQPNADPKKRKQGSGLGLWLTKIMVEKLGGQIKVESQPGKGSTFTVVIECQAVSGEENLKKELSLHKASKSEGGAAKKAVILGQNAMENLVIKTYMKNLGFDSINEAVDLKDLWKYLDNHSEQETVVVLNEKYTEGLNSLYKWDKELLSRKLVMIIEDSVQDHKTQCIIDGSRWLESPVRFSDFSKALMGNIALHTQ